MNASTRAARIGSNQIIGSTTLEVQGDMGILYLHASDGRTLLKITGLPTPLPDFLQSSSSGSELTIEVLTQTDTIPTEGSQVAAARRSTVSNLKALLRNAGATLVPKV
jgi:hypothetical protein